MVNAKMKIFLPLVTWIVLSFSTTVHSQQKQQVLPAHRKVGFGLNREVFFLNLEDGYFGCQVNESTDYLQLYELSKLCDGTPDCYLGSDELHDKLKCSNDCTKEGTECSNGVCLDSQCHCNDGFGGCNCQVPDENECKYRPCDVFSHCTNTLGSFTCTCFPGYRGNGLQCEDIDECADPAIAARCVDNAECCNLPAHFLCKCKPGFEGDGEELCLDINECDQPGACGINTQCFNTPGNYSCACQTGFEGNPYDGCVDVNECANPHVCGEGAICTNLEGSYRCDCPPGFDGDARTTGCLDFDECARAPCGRNALCSNSVGSFKCQCPQGFLGDPMVDCQDVNECQDEPCGPNAVCTDTVGSFVCSCKPEFTGDPYRGCIDIDECAVLEKPCGNHAVCENTSPGYNCLCPQGFRANPDAKIACEQRDVNILCTSNFDCTNNAECIEGQCFCQDGFQPEGSVCVDIDECQDEGICGGFAQCINIPGSFKCNCFAGYVGSPPRVQCKAPCEDVKCGPHAYCKPDGVEAYCICEDGWTFNPSDIAAGCVDIDECDPIHGPSGKCGSNAICKNAPGGYSCQCPPGFTGDAKRSCVDLDECSRPNACGEGALCHNLAGSYDCSCPEGTIADPDPRVRCIAVVTCTSDSDCPGNAICDEHKRCLCPEPNIGNDCRLPVSCQSDHDCLGGQTCSNTMCLPSCNNDLDCALNEKCISRTCMLTCRVDNDCFLGHICLRNKCVFGCHTDDDCSASESCRNNHCNNPCHENPCGPNALCSVSNHRATCTCSTGMIPSPTAKVGCVRSPALPCTENRQCPEGFACFTDMCRPLCANDAGCLNNERCENGACKPLCRRDDDCRHGEICQGLICGQGCRSDAGCADHLACVNHQCVDPCSDPTACGTNAECQVISHAAQCVCPAPLIGNPLVACRFEPVGCANNKDCPPNHSCYGQTCLVNCRSDQNCLADERCIRGTCRTICNSDASCGDGLICENRVCKTGCRSDVNCASDQACIDKQCKNPCTVSGQCGTCAECNVVNHGVQCSCPNGYQGNPLTGCNQPLQRCNSYCQCDEYGVFCAETCNDDSQCSCGQICSVGKCRIQCNPGACPPGQLCKDGACVAGCRSNSDCPNENSCINGQCLNPCLRENACGKNADCRVSDHRVLCLCPGGYRGEPTEECTPFECQSDNDCEADKRCKDGSCKNPCLELNTCGINAQCRVVNRNSQCSCPPGHIGNPLIECQQVTPGICLKNPCGDNAVCREVAGGYECICAKGCVGDPKRGCLCDGQQVNACADLHCGVNAGCRVHGHNEPECYCPTEYPSGDPYVQCTNERRYDDCRSTGCQVGQCVQQGYLFVCRQDIGCTSHTECPSQKACYNSRCVDPCVASNPCQSDQECQVQNHQPVCVKVCQCQKKTDCRGGLVCDGCNCIVQHDPVITDACAHCPPGIPCDPLTGACVREPPGSPKRPDPCKSDNDCLETEVCYMGLCEDPCHLKDVCAPTALCHAKMHKPVCTCPKGHEGNPSIKCIRVEPFKCTRNEDCSLTEACIGGMCQQPCDLHNPCAHNAVCVNTNHGSDCSCAENYQGNGYIGCVPVMDYQPICQYNEDCPPDKLCDRLNRRCINPCQEDSCGENAECYPVNHGIDCRCYQGFLGNPYIECQQELGCRSDSECNSYEACINRKCQSPCQCGKFAVCNVLNHVAECKCPDGYTGNPLSACAPPSNPCVPNPCGINALCELDRGNPICFCPKGLTGNPFKKCIPEGNECQPNPCGPNSGCRVVNGQPTCFCLPEYEGQPPEEPCRLPQNPCEPSPCGPNTQCAILSNGFAKCTCLQGYIESPNTIRGCVAPKNPCDPNPCGFGAICDSTRNPVCYCPEQTVGNPYRSCNEPVITPELCKPGPCGHNADCYIANNREECYCRSGFIGDPYSGCREIPRSVCEPNPCGPGAQCIVSADGKSACRCPEGMKGDPTSAYGCQSYECLVDDDCPYDRACVGYRCQDPCPGSCGIGAYCRVEKHHPVCFCNHGLTGNPLIRCQILSDPIPSKHPCQPSPCGVNTDCQVLNDRAVCSCIQTYLGDPQSGCRPECTINSDCPLSKACMNRKCVNPCDGTLCGINAECRVDNHTPTCTCQQNYMGDPFFQCMLPPPVTEPKEPCHYNPCDPNSVCFPYGNDVAICDPCSGPHAFSYAHCRPECLTNADCAFDKACLGKKCVDPCPGSCGHNAICTVVHHNPVCQCPQGLYGNPFEHCSPPSPAVPQRPETCDTIRCGANAECRQQNGVLACVCKKEFYGDPLIGCRPECVINPDCPSNKACVNTKCVDPCINSCGLNAKCQVVNHFPVCFCPAGYTGNAQIQCGVYREPVTPIQPSNPCDPSPCGPNSRCLLSPEGYAICSCLPDYKGTPPVCQPECHISAECPLNRACINLKCVDPCPGTCGLGAYCEVINHNPICSCPSGQEGDPFVSCRYPEETGVVKAPENPCVPSPCGPNSICQVHQGHPVCSCVANYIGSPPYCRPECVVSDECPQDKACIKEKCKNPCTDICGQNAQCHVVAHSAFCSCLPGHQGDAFVGCVKIPVIYPVEKYEPCNPSPCAENAQCTEIRGEAKCTCIPPYLGDPYISGCRPECVYGSDCVSHLACINQHCRDPCIGVCGPNAECSVVNHIPNCVCHRGYRGDPFTGCRVEPPPPPISPLDPCQPSPCGANSICRAVDGRATCSCQPNYFGAPPNCRPECIVSSECSRDRSCINQKCKDPCPGICGIEAICHVNNHNPICSCPSNYIGDPFEHCRPKPIDEAPKQSNPCIPSPCGANSDCREFDNKAVCSCLPGMLGAPPSCRPECAIHQDCPSNRACMNQRCSDPCIGACGFNALCIAQNHQPKCTCFEGFDGDPYAGCNQRPILEEPKTPCSPSPCGVNAICKERNGAGSCSCIPEYHGDPYIECRPECVMNSDCPRTRACVNNKCIDPCPGTCGLNAECHIVNHAPSCSCIPGYTGDPLNACRLPPPVLPTIIENPCEPSPCGPHSQCRAINSHAVCSCISNYIGSPPNCRPECVVSSECVLDKSCINQKCKDPCPGTCGVNARCQVVNHNPICSCQTGHIGDPFVRCVVEQKTPVVHDPIPSCTPSPCGPNSVCREIGSVPVCSCIQNYVGRPPNCRPECTSNAECPSSQACINEHCRDPCPGSCGSFATCQVANHRPMCRCISEYHGDPFIGCTPNPIIQYQPEIPMPCNPSPCGVNAICKERNGAGSCSCLPEYFGDPYVECRPECILNSDCIKSKACINTKCVDPCPGVCGINAECQATNHIPICFCIAGYTGDPSTVCQPIKQMDPTPINPCQPSPCGPFSECRVHNEHAICACLKNYVGSPPSCRPECSVSAECVPDKACVNQRCIDPCPGTCGQHARCHVTNHNPICSCSPGFTGDPFIKCVVVERPPVVNEPVGNPCEPSPCGPNSQCRVVGDLPICSCLPNYIGRSPNCRPECTSNSECPSNSACINEKCKDPCPGSCGFNAFCTVVKHRAICNCESGYTGDPFTHCQAIPPTVIQEEVRTPCNPTPCGPNAICKERNGAGSCSCIFEYFGDPYTGCRPECTINSDCPKNRACLNNKCRDPCPGVCGINAECEVVNHSPSCICIFGYVGDPLQHCHEPSPPKQNEPLDPCNPSPCGPHSQCRNVNEHAVCSCIANYIGSPPNCRPECVVSSECAQNKACTNQKCIDPCPGTCGLNARCQVINHNPICSCDTGYYGDPFTRCILENKTPVIESSGNPCVPSPCGPNSQCRVIGETPVCSCLPNYLGRAPNCRPECMINAECSSNLACVNERCVDPCPGSCGVLATCTVLSHKPMCKCPQGYTGDPFNNCFVIPIMDPIPEVHDPCQPSPCGANAVCRERNGAGSCSCLPEYFGDPYNGCRPECIQNSDCDRAKACLNNKCQDPCPGVCGINAECAVHNHAPNCACITGYTGDASRSCYRIEITTTPAPFHPCHPSPCGPNSNCREVNGHAVCTCVSEFIGSPPNCRPECVVSSECQQDRACINQKCKDPCPGTCGVNANCQVVNHSPICSCKQGYSGDPFIKCSREEAPPPPRDSGNPCVPSPCGPNSQCRVFGSQGACSCSPGYVGRPPNCRPECTIDAECPSNLACTNEKCRDPCPGSCGINSVCRVIKHAPICTCDVGYEGDPLIQCNIPEPPSTERSPPLNPCSPSPCGPNAQCRERNGAGACYCFDGYEGNAYDIIRGCRRECEHNDDCPTRLACIKFKCIDPCVGICGVEAICSVRNHIPDCSCPSGYKGDPFVECRIEPVTIPPRQNINLCHPSPCGPNSQCREVNGQAVCSCLPTYIGSPPGCRPECVVSSECPLDKACVNQKCVDPCPGTCGQNAQCRVNNHSPICSCINGYTGDPFNRCYLIPAPPIQQNPINPCDPSPCGPNSECRDIGGIPSCSCLINYIGSPPNCRPECTINPECSSHLACIRQKCTDPCPGSCGPNADCSVVNHNSICTCDAGYTGDPFVGCTLKQVEVPKENISPCTPSPCGANAVCREQNGAGSCTCLPEYFGNPYEGCRPECVLNSDCPSNRACIRNKCQDPCPGTCGQNADCQVVNHLPSCSCLLGFTGDPFRYCSPLPVEKIEQDYVNPCQPSPCGPNSQCREVNGQAVCSCLPTYIGSPPGCRPECVVSSECPLDKACVNQKCVDPCPGTCGQNAQCRVNNHSPICSCISGYTGDPFSRCYPIPPPPPPPQQDVYRDPCNPSPCGPNSQCRDLGGSPSCSCLANYIGSPPNCRPECTINAECQSSLACIREKCRDPCPGSCGFNARCSVINHTPICVCPEGYTGDPFTSCQPAPPPPREPVHDDPCNPSPCGANAECNNGICTCLPEYQGDPYRGCRPECVLNSDCARNKACIRNKCTDPCPGTCGTNAICDVINHIPVCSCPDGMTGNAFVHCRPIPQQSPIETNPCNPSPCGPNSQCREVNQQAVCSCVSGYIGSPPNCRPECVLNSDCPQNEACINQKCRDPCPGTCGIGAQCSVVNHNPICSCPVRYTGDPFVRCQPIIEQPVQQDPINPCQPSPCGPNSECRVVGVSHSCSCLEGYIGSPPNCRPECVSNSECSYNLACIRQKCRDPCSGACGISATCTAIMHSAHCSCSQGFSGNPLVQCVFIQEQPPTPSVPTPCNPSPCGVNALCRVSGNQEICECLQDYQGNPYDVCRPECVGNSDCPRNRACIRNKCIDPCPGVCGIDAVCAVVNHIPTCTCPNEMTGDAFRQCSPVHRVDEPYQPDPCYPSPCGLNTICRRQGNTAHCECLPGYSGQPSGTGCRPECTINSDCPRNLACVNTKCVDPCPGVCGYNAQCHVVNHSPICSCTDKLVGDPFVECRVPQIHPNDPCNPSPCAENGICRVHNGAAVCTYPECVINEDCSRDRACFNQKCRNPCIDACGLSAICNVINHKAVCSCPPNYQGSPFIECYRPRDEPPVVRPECEVDQDCSNDKACINQKCINPCTNNPGICGQNAECHVQLHRPICVCRDGFTGNAQRICYEIGCRADSDCPPTQACINRECVDPCLNTQCGTNAVCRSDYNHRARCYCLDNYRGNPLISCTRPECVADYDCPFHLACQNEQCRDPCDCGLNALCRVDNHVASCKCPPGYNGNPKTACQIIPIQSSPECTMDADCPSKLACFSGVCKNPCDETKPCGANSICTVVDTLPLRTMVCQCLPGYVGNADIECRLARDEGCKSNKDCLTTEVCRSGVCENPCTVANPCARNAECVAQNHRAVCRCTLGMVGDPFVNCFQEPVSAVECRIDSECPSDKACINERCQNPCADSNPCAGNAECRVSNHRPLCYCPQGWGGDPQVQCFRPECESDTDCPYDKACYNQKCLNPCSYGPLQCGRGAECFAQNHRANCVCQPGFQGNPLVSCVRGLCQYNEDCADHEACDRLNRVCRPVCDDDTCADTAICLGKNHQPVCECRPGTSGNPYVACEAPRVPIEPECRVDQDCPSKLACFNNRCEDPCAKSNVCHPDQTCTVVDTLPVRTMMCRCPNDQIVDNSGRCVPIKQDEPACRNNLECADPEVCVRGVCVIACRVESCGVNAQCLSTQHRVVCTCAPGYEGNPHIECSPIPKIPHRPDPVECYNNDDCPFDKKCTNQHCVNPCINACGRGAYCNPVNHEPVCICPPGYNGNPKTQCNPPSEATIGCTSNSDCGLSESCINRICSNPCVCGENADCRIVDHYGACYCKPGYSGNPQTGCFKRECSSDDQCSNDKQCLNGECINPCLIADPCAVNAECYGHNHRANCRCISGTEGNPLEVCKRLECRSDYECPDNKACRNNHCVNPCTEDAPCASNAVCYPRNHVASCLCPEHLPLGNPLSYCERKPPPVSKPECVYDPDCPSKLACINGRCRDPCLELKPCASSAKCSVLNSIPVRTMICECPELWVPDTNGECRQLVLQNPPGCESDSECPSTEACINRQCRNPCDCGINAICHIQNHRAVCSCEDGYEGNPKSACRTVGCRTDTECDTGKACINSICVNPCIIQDPCGENAECYVHGNKPECRCRSGYRGNPWERCHVIGCRSNSDCPTEKQCENSQCIDPCIYDNPCSTRAECRPQNHQPVCKCPPGMIGNPYVDCRPEPQPECKMDADCPSRLACIDHHCVDPCLELQPCNKPSRCEVVPSLPLRTMICICPDGYVSSGSGTCKPTQPVEKIGGCITDSECPSDKACVNGICRNPCNCGPNAECRIKDHKPVCSCQQGFDGNPEIECVRIGCRSDDECSGQHTCINRQCVPVCEENTCARQAECYGVNHRAVCECKPGYSGDPRISCVLLGCRSDTDCPTDKACINTRCENPCESRATCARDEICQVYNHRPECACPVGYIGDYEKGCKQLDPICQNDGDCPSQTACITSECVNPCNVTEPCGVNAECRVIDTVPLRTMVCVCLPGFQGNAAVQCDKMELCKIERGFVRDINGECVCPPGTALNVYEECVPCLVQEGFKIDETGHCVCALERGMVIDERGRCICPTDFGYRLTDRGECIRVDVPECEVNADCADNRYCNLDTKTCDDPCITQVCGENALCNATNHEAICVCISGYSGNPYEICNTVSRKDFPPPDMVVSCLADGVQVEIHIAERGFNGVLYVKGYSKDEECRRVVNLDNDSGTKTEIFKVNFGSCGLNHINGVASFVLVIQKHPKLVTYKAQAYHIKCIYQTGEQNVTLGFNVSMLTTAGTIANTGPPPVCAMKIVKYNGQEITSAEIGDNLMLQVDVQPATIYGGFARGCVAKTMEDNVENEYMVTDEDGCATDPSIFGDWEYNAETNSLLASFNAFKFPSSDNIRFQCNIRVCFGRCQPVNCRGYDAFGKRRKRRQIEDMNRTSTALAEGGEFGLEGQLREEIVIQSNAILTFEKRDEKQGDPNKISPAAQRVEDICVSMVGLIIALVITALLALVAVAVAVSCWLMAYRRRPKVTGPLPHPPEFPNPLFANPESSRE